MLQRGDAEALWVYVGTEEGRLDQQVKERLLHLLPVTDPRYGQLVDAGEGFSAGR